MSHLVSGALTLRLRGGPQLQVLEPIVGADTVDVMDDLARTEGSSEVSRHHQPVLADLRLAAGEVAKFGRHHHAPVAVTQPTLAGDDADGHVSINVAALHGTLVVRAAETLGVGEPVAVADAADLRLPPAAERDVLGDITGPLPA